MKFFSRFSPAVLFVSISLVGCRNDGPGNDGASVRTPAADTVATATIDTHAVDTSGTAARDISTGGMSATDSLAKAAAADRAEQARASTACGWITEAEASLALGQPSVYGRSDDGGRSCIIEPAEPKEGKTLSVDFRVEENGAYRFDYYASMKGSGPVTKLGDRAIWAAGEMTGTLVVAKGANTLMVSLSGARSGPAMRGKAIALAGIIVDRM